MRNDFAALAVIFGLLVLIFVVDYFVMKGTRLEQREQRRLERLERLEHPLGKPLEHPLEQEPWNNE